jgi:hypothetical protein
VRWVVEQRFFSNNVAVLKSMLDIKNNYWALDEDKLDKAGGLPMKLFHPSGRVSILECRAPPWKRGKFAEPRVPRGLVVEELQAGELAAARESFNKNRQEYKRRCWRHHEGNSLARPEEPPADKGDEDLFEQMLESYVVDGSDDEDEDDDEDDEEDDDEEDDDEEEDDEEDDDDDDDDEPAI